MLCHVSTDSGVFLSEIVLTGQNRTISAHWNEFTQNRWFFAISSNTDGSKYFTRKCDDFLELTRGRVEVVDSFLDVPMKAARAKFMFLWGRDPYLKGVHFCVSCDTYPSRSLIVLSCFVLIDSLY
jgi:hypothetical protein